MGKCVYTYVGKLSKEQQDKIIQGLSKDKIKEASFTEDDWLKTTPTNNTPDTVWETNMALISGHVPKGIIYVEGEQGITYPIEHIDPSYKDLLKQEIEYESSNFSLDDFFKDKRDRAVIVITPDDTIRTFTWLDHGRGTLQIYNYLYDEEETEWQSPIWQFGAIEKGNVVIQLCDTEYTPVWLPYKMNEYQYRELTYLFTEMERINEEGNYGIEVAIDYDGQVPIAAAKDKLNEICSSKNIYTVPKTK